MAGPIEWAGKVFGWNSERRNPGKDDNPRKPSTDTRPAPEMLGTGTASKAGRQLQGRKGRLDKAIEEAGG